MIGDFAHTMRILISGSRGFVGSSLMPVLDADGHRLARLVRAESTAANAIAWNPETGHVDREALEGLDAVVHLAGEPIATRWTSAKKARIRASRVDGTRMLSDVLASLRTPPRAMVCASAIGYYGSRGDEVLTEDSPPGDGFLAELCQQWERAAEPAIQRGIRVVHLRIGVVLSTDGGALGKILPIFRMGMGGRVGNGRQYWSWIAMEDLIGAMRHVLVTDTLRGAVNAVTPNPATNKHFTKALGRALKRPTLFPLPAFAARLMLGEMAEELLLSSARVHPGKLLMNGFTFRYPELDTALQHLLS